jgi:hypothetical protein
VLDRLAGILSVEEMRQLNYAVDGEKRQARDVVAEFLTLKGLTSTKQLAQKNDSHPINRSPNCLVCAQGPQGRRGSLAQPEPSHARP